MVARPSKLNAKQRRFVKEYLIDLNATKAAVRAGYSEATARQVGSRLLTNVDIASAVEKAQLARAEQVGITADSVLKELATIGFSDPRAVMKWGPDGVVLKSSDELTDAQAALIAEVAQTKDGMRVKLHSKLEALARLGQHLGLLKEKVEHSGPNGGPIETVGINTNDPIEAAKAYQRLIAGK